MISPSSLEFACVTSPPIMNGKNSNAYTVVRDIYVTPQKGSSNRLDSVENFGVTLTVDIQEEAKEAHQELHRHS